MLVQHRRDGRVRLIRQQDHALLAGELAAGWVGLGREPAPLSFELVLAAALHDLAWIPLDRRPRLDPLTGLPIPFDRLPATEKTEAYVRGLDRACEIHPYAGLLGSLHYTTFPDVAEEEAFQAGERRRRRRLRHTLGLGEEDEARVRRDLAYLRLFDGLSLFLCLTPPSAEPEARPPWVERARRAGLPDGTALHLTWSSEEVIHVDPFPFRRGLRLRVPYRELTAPIESGEELVAAWTRAPWAIWWLEVRSSLRLA